MMILPRRGSCSLRMKLEALFTFFARCLVFCFGKITFISFGNYFCGARNLLCLFICIGRNPCSTHVRNELSKAPFGGHALQRGKVYDIK